MRNEAELHRPLATKELTLIDSIQDVVTVEKEYRASARTKHHLGRAATRMLEMPEVVAAHARLDERVGDTLLQVGFLDEDSDIASGVEEVLDTETAKQVRSTKLSRAAFSGSVQRVLEQRHQMLTDATSDAERLVVEEEYDLLKDGADRLATYLEMPSLRSNQDGDNQEVQPEAAVEVSVQSREQFDETITLDRQTFAELYRASTKDAATGLREMGAKFIDVYHASTLKIDAGRSGANFSKQEQLNAIGHANLYARFVGDLIQKLPDDKGRQRMMDWFGDQVSEYAQQRRKHDRGFDVAAVEREVAMMTTGIKLEIASYAALEQKMDDFGWQAIRQATVDEDVQQGIDLIVTDANGKEIPIDVKSDASFNRQKGDPGPIEGVKFKHRNGNRVVVVNSQALGLGKNEHGKAIGVKDFKLYRKHEFALAIDAAIHAY